MLCSNPPQPIFSNIDYNPLVQRPLESEHLSLADVLFIVKNPNSQIPLVRTSSKLIANRAIKLICSKEPAQRTMEYLRNAESSVSANQRKNYRNAFETKNGKFMFKKIDFPLFLFSLGVLYGKINDIQAENVLPKFLKAIRIVYQSQQHTL